MPGMLMDGGGAIVPFSGEPGHAVAAAPPVRNIRHGVAPPISRVYVSFSSGNLLQVACLRPPNPEGGGDRGAEEVSGGRVVEVNLGGGGSGPGGADAEEIDEAEMRRIEYGSVPAFALLQSRKNALVDGSGMSRLPSVSEHAEWWQYVLEYSKTIGSLLGNPDSLSAYMIDDPKMILKVKEKPTSLKAAWELLEIFFVDKQLQTWLPERLVDWLADYDSLLTKTENTIYRTLINFQKKLINLQVVEDDPDYWSGLSAALSVGWLDIVVNMLRFHGSYQLDQMDSRETENGLVEAVAVLVSTMPRMRPDLPSGKLGQCCKTRPDFIKALEKWRGQVSKLECSAFWIQCGHQKTRDGLKSLLHIMLGNIKNLTASTSHWLELFASHLLYIRPFTVGFEGMHQLAQKCIQLKPSADNSGLTGLLTGILSENTEVVLAECTKNFGPWMVTHAMELLTADNDYADMMLHEEKPNFGGISIEELHRLVYAQVLCSHALTWQIAPTYLSSCLNQGLGLLEILLLKQPIQDNRVVLKTLEICRLYELENVSTNIMKIAGIYHWKHGRKGTGVYWFQQANDKVRLDRIAQQLFEHIGKSVTDDSFKQWEGLLELLGSDIGSAGGLEFLHRYRDFKRSLQMAQEGRTGESVRQTVEFLIQLMRNPSTPQRFWLPLLHDSVRLLNCKPCPLLNVAETTLLLNKLQELSLAKLRPDFSNIHLPIHALNSVRLALASNLARAILEEP
ncbi:nuclear pore complex protein NUP85 [Oryza glaberrima]|uniref:Nuclear pore complex protein Nup85 n=1 Tax=Oryza barthii TaxID=65489 RepID=A0A0D3ETX9_9ORYZ|nr:nuclear pore complex protein NUP85 [Oryza glaberrima]